MKNSKKSAKKKSGVWAKTYATIGVVFIVAAVIMAIAAVTNNITIGRKTVGIDEEFYLEPGQTVFLKELSNTPLKLDSIENGLYVDDDNDPNQIIFSWEGQIYYHFVYDETEIVVGSSLDADKSRPIGSIYTLDFVSGDENSGTFVLRKVAE